jgi:hypothetical protein
MRHNTQYFHGLCPVQWFSTQDVDPGDETEIHPIISLWTFVPLRVSPCRKFSANLWHIFQLNLLVCTCSLYTLSSSPLVFLVTPQHFENCLHCRFHCIFNKIFMWHSETSTSNHSLHFKLYSGRFLLICRYIWQENFNADSDSWIIDYVGSVLITIMKSAQWYLASSLLLQRATELRRKINCIFKNVIHDA